MDVFRLPTSELCCNDSVKRELYVNFYVPDPFKKTMDAWKTETIQIAWPPPFDRPDIIFYDELMMTIQIPYWVEYFQFHQIFVIETEFWFKKKIELKSNPVNHSAKFWVNGKWLGGGLLISKFGKVYDLNIPGDLSVCLQRKI